MLAGRATFYSMHKGVERADARSVDGPRWRASSSKQSGSDLGMTSECRRDEWAALERLLTLCQFEEGALDDRLQALPLRAFGRAALDLYELGWANTTKE